MISFLIATSGRPSLRKTLRSIETMPGDEIVVVGNVEEKQDGNIRYIPCAPGHDWGHSERNFALPLCRGRYIAHIDDDDYYASGSRRIMGRALEEANGRPVIFRMRYPCGVTLWREPKIVCGNIGTPMFVMPNQPEMFGTWGSFVGGDCHFLETSKWKQEDYVWKSDIIVMLGHDIT